jgi:hypothetical protein
VTFAIFTFYLNFIYFITYCYDHLWNHINRKNYLEYFNFVLFLIKYVHWPICSYLLIYQFNRLHNKRASLEKTDAKMLYQIL